MPDSRIIDYLRQNQGKFPLDALKAALVKQGFPEADVDEAARQASGEAPSVGVPPPPGAALGTEPPADRVSFGLVTALPNAKAMLTNPKEFFSRLDPSESFKASLVTIAFWSVVTAVIQLPINAFRSNPIPWPFAVGTVFTMPILSAIISWPSAGIYHVLCLILGGKAGFKSSYQAFAAMSALFPLSAIFSNLPFGFAVPLSVSLWLSINHANSAHGISKVKAGVVMGIITLLTIVGLAFLVAVGQMTNYGFPGTTAPNTANGMPEGIPSDVAQTLGALGGQMTPETQKLMADAMQNPGAILQELTKYGSLAEPPEATMALLDSAGQARLAKAWPTMSAPLRKSLVETLPSVPEGERPAFMDQMEAYTKDMDATLQQSMKLIEQAQQQLNQPNRK